MRHAAHGALPAATALRLGTLIALAFVIGYLLGSRGTQESVLAPDRQAGLGRRGVIGQQSVTRNYQRHYPPPNQTLADALSREAEEKRQQGAKSKAEAQRSAEAVRAARLAQALRQLPWEQQPPAELSVCSDTCVLARNGVCDEGRPARGDDATAPRVVLCDLGTDCQDCGPWQHVGPPEAASWRPVEQLRAEGFGLWLRPSATPSPFWVPHADPEVDTGASKELAATGLVDPAVSFAWNKIVESGCVAPGGDRALVLDVGAGFGWYTLMAATAGCRVIAWEQVPRFAAYLQYGLQRNRLASLVEVRVAVVRERQGSNISVAVPVRGDWGTASAGGLRLTGRPAELAGQTEWLVVPAERLDIVAESEAVLALRVDAGGFEPEALASANITGAARSVQNVLLAYEPGVAPRQGGTMAFEWDKLLRMEALPAMLQTLAWANYTLLHLNSTYYPVAPADSGRSSSRGGGGGGRWTGGAPEWGAPLPRLELVDPDSLQHDVNDAKTAQKWQLGCPLPTELEPHRGLWSCNWMPQALDPRSFHSAFLGRTHVWAALQGSGSAGLAAAAARRASLLQADDDVRDFFPSSGGSEFGMGRRRCASLPPEDLVAYRCHCTEPEVCGELAALVVQQAKAGLLVPGGKDQQHQEDLLGIERWERHFGPGS